MVEFSWEQFEEKINAWCDCIEFKAQSENKDVKLWFKEGKKYYKIFVVLNNDEKVHAIVNRLNGDILKRISNKNKSKYNLFKNYKNLIDDCEFTGSYLK